MLYIIVGDKLTILLYEMCVQTRLQLLLLLLLLQFVFFIKPHIKTTYNIILYIYFYIIFLLFYVVYITQHRKPHRILYYIYVCFQKGQRPLSKENGPFSSNKRAFKNICKINTTFHFILYFINCGSKECFLI
jgi:hypothetical protein